MKILHVITSLQTGGAEKLMVDLLPQLRDMGNDVELLLFDGTRTHFYKELERAGIKIHHLSIGGNVYNPINIFKLRKYLKNYDIIHTHNTACQLFAAICRMLCSVKLVTTEHTTSNRRRDWRWYKPLDRWMYSQYKRVICISDQAIDSLVEYHGESKRNCVIYNGVNIDRYLNPIKDISAKNDYIISMVAGFRYQKDHETLIKACALLPVNYTLRLIGEGERRQILQQLVAELGIEKRVEFMGLRSNISELLAESDINVLSSHFEGLSLSSIEGMASGRPFIASDVNGLREIVTGYGILFPHGDADALAKEIKMLCENPEHYKQVAIACQEKAKQYDISIMAQKYNDLYNSIKLTFYNENNSNHFGYFTLL